MRQQTLSGVKGAREDDGRGRINEIKSKYVELKQTTGNNQSESQKKKWSFQGRNLISTQSSNFFFWTEKVCKDLRNVMSKKMDLEWKKMCRCTNNESDCELSLGRDRGLINNLRLFMGGGVRYRIRVGVGDWGSLFTWEWSVGRVTVEGGWTHYQTRLLERTTAHAWDTSAQIPVWAPPDSALFGKSANFCTEVERIPVEA